MKVILIFPPVCDLRAPYLALPSLSAFLRKNKYNVIQKDVNLEACLYFLQPQILLEAYQKVKNKYNNFNKRKSLSLDELKCYYNLARRVSFASFVIKNIEKAKRILRDKYDFFDINKHNLARAVINEALALYAQSYDPSIEYKIEGQCYEIKYNPYNLKELKKAVCDRKNNIFIDYFDTHTVPHLLKEKPILAGISIATKHQILPGLTLAHMLKKKNIYTVIGGSYFTRFIDELKSNNSFFNFCDSVIIYEGEHALMELIEQLRSSLPDFSKVPNLVYLQNGSVKMNLPIYIEDLNKLPAPDFDGLLLDRYLSPYPVLPLALGKGCYWDRCRFCDIPFSSNIKRGIYRTRNIKYVIDDINFLSHKYRTNNFFFTDETIPAKRLYQLAKALCKNKIKINYACFARLEPDFTDKVYQKISKWGCRKIVFGLESGFQRTLDFINKGYKISCIKKTLSNCYKNKIAYCLFVIIGFANETEIAAEKSIRFLYKNRNLIDQPFNSLYVHQFKLTKHAEFFVKPRDYGIIKIQKNPDEILRNTGWDYESRNGIDNLYADKIYTQIFDRICKDFTYFSVNKNGVPGWEEYDILFIDHFHKNLKKWPEFFSKSDNIMSLRPFWPPANFIIKLNFDISLLDRKNRIRRLESPKKFVFVLYFDDKIFESDALLEKIIYQCNGRNSIKSIIKDIKLKSKKKELVDFFNKLLVKRILVLDNQEYFTSSIGSNL